MATYLRWQKVRTYSFLDTLVKGTSSQLLSESSYCDVTTILLPKTLVECVKVQFGSCSKAGLHDSQSFSSLELTLGPKGTHPINDQISPYFNSQDLCLHFWQYGCLCFCDKVRLDLALRYSRGMHLLSMIAVTVFPAA